MLDVLLCFDRPKTFKTTLGFGRFCKDIILIFVCIYLLYLYIDLDIDYTMICIYIYLDLDLDIYSSICIYTCMSLLMLVRERKRGYTTFLCRVLGWCAPNVFQETER